MAHYRYESYIGMGHNKHGVNLTNNVGQQWTRFWDSDETLAERHFCMNAIGEGICVGLPNLWTGYCIVWGG